jgi:hypothetical protein
MLSVFYFGLLLALALHPPPSKAKRFGIRFEMNTSQYESNGIFFQRIFRLSLQLDSPLSRSALGQTAFAVFSQKHTKKG